MPLKYTSVEGLRALLSDQEIEQLSDDTSADGHLAIDDEIVEAHLMYAESTAESYVQARYGSPLAEPVPEAFRYAVYAIARYRLMLRRGFMTEEISAEYDQQRTWLESIKGEGADLYPISDDDPTDVSFGTSHNVHFDDEFFL